MKSINYIKQARGGGDARARSLRCKAPNFIPSKSPDLRWGVVGFGAVRGAGSRAARGRPRAQLTLQSPEFYTVKKPRLTLGGGGGLGVDWGAGNHQKRRRRTICRQRGSPPRIAAGVHAGDFLVYSFFFVLSSLFFNRKRTPFKPGSFGYYSLSFFLSSFGGSFFS